MIIPPAGMSTLALILCLLVSTRTGYESSAHQTRKETLEGLSVLPTVTVREGSNRGFNQRIIDESRELRSRKGASVLDSGYWLLDFTFKPLRWQTIEMPCGRHADVLYLYYRVVNRTGRSRAFVPRFTLVTDGDQRKEELVLPSAVRVIQEREDPSVHLLGAVSIDGEIPPSTEVGTEQAVFGVALWEGIDRRVRNFHVYVQGLSDGYQLASSRNGVEPSVRYKTLRLDYFRRGRTIIPADPPYEWIYWR
jgi:hypothetical protein